MFKQSTCAAIKIRGDKELEGTVKAVTDKVSLVHLLLASLILKNKTTINDVHFCGDILTILDWIVSNKLARIEKKNNQIQIDPISDSSFDLVGISKIRASVCLLAPLALKLGEVKLGKVGGCNFTERKIDLHLRLAEAFGIQIEEKSGDYYAIKKNNLEKVAFNCATIYGPSVGVTCHGLIASMLFGGEVTLYNIAKEAAPMLLVRYINTATNRHMELSGDMLKISATSSIVHNPVQIKAPLDITVAFTFISSVIVAGGNIFIEGLDSIPFSITDVLKDMNVFCEFETKGVHICVKDKIRHPEFIECMPWPGFPTDCGPILAGALSPHEGKTLINDYLYEQRTSHVSGLNSMGYNLTASGRRVIIIGKKSQLRTVEVEANDIRAGAALLIGALGRSAETIITGYQQVFRGYASLLEDLEKIGACIAPLQ